MNKNIKKKSLKTQVKMGNLVLFLNNFQYIFVINDLTLNAQHLLSKFQTENIINKIVIKSKLLIYVLIKRGILNKNMIFIKGPILLIGLNNINTFKILLNLVILQLKNNLDLLFLIVNNLLINVKDVQYIFINLIKNLGFFQYYNCLSIKYRKELLNCLLFSTYFIEVQLIGKLKVY